MKLKSIPGLDVLKFSMALLVVAIHAEAVNIYKNIYAIIHPLTDIAVPLFFLISSFLVFSKIRLSNDSRETLLHLSKRLLILYAFWMLIQTPLVIYTRDYLQQDLLTLPLYIIRDILFCSTFHGSWFLSALVIGVWLIFFLSKFITDKYIWILPFFISIYTYHYDLFPTNWHYLYQWYTNTFQTPLNSFPVSLMWITCGYILSNIQVSKVISNCNNLILISIFIISWILSIILSWDMRFFMVSSLFILSFNWNISYKPIHKYMRQSSILIYITHFIFIVLFRHLFPKIEILQHGIILYIILIILCLLTSFIILRLKEYKIFSWLKYSY